MGAFADSDPSIWGAAVGISIIIGLALTGNMYRGPFAKYWHENKFATFRVFCIPFCVSSYAATVASSGSDFAFIFPKNAGLTVGGLLLSGGLTGLLFGLRKYAIYKSWYVPGEGGGTAHVHLEEKDISEKAAPNAMSTAGTGPIVSEMKQV